MKLQAVVEQLQKQQQQQQQTTPLQMDSRERQQRQMREAQLHYGPQLTAQQAAFSAASGKPSGGAAHPPPARVPPVFGAARTFDQSSVNSEEEEDEEGDEDLEDRDLEEDAASRGKDVCSALKYFQASKAVPHNQRVASSSHPLPALGAQRGHQGKEEQGKEAATPLYSGSTSGRQTWRLDEQQLKQNGNLSWNEDADNSRGREVSRDFAKLYELDGDPERKKFLDDLFVFMQKRGTPINRIPIMAKQILDLYMLYKLVTEKGGLVEIINKKIWREITKGLNLPTSITSAAFTLRTQYMKYLYAYECEKKALSSPAELQAAIDGNRREGRRPSYSSSLFGYSPAAAGAPPSLLCPPKIRFPVVSLAPSGTTSSPHLSLAATLRKGDGTPVTMSTPNRVAMPVTLASQQATAAARTATLEQLRERLESGEPPEKVSRMTEEEQRFVQQAFQRNLFSMARQLPMKIKINGREDKSDSAASAASALNWTPSGFGSINMSVEINGTIYAGVLFAQKPVVHLIAGSSTQSTGGGSSNSSHCSPSPTSSRGTPSAEPSTSWSL
ncbi:AT-rich interactive domain-containing protein 3B isoform X2 [Sphaerodactylus townsendi]|uniref:AT-rich interactive domain-containing protein 3B isoform X2 n=1 Tax=Sphaerodactylus townsendi TaxID=933632 RepID=UPI002026A75A|nr:AT-rich interactive domain-containing protein 3B isoform X2 [Sphaerodactylus townsendi]